MLNVMMDPENIFHPLPHPINHNRSYDFKRKTRQFARTGHPTKYYYIDFGLSHLFSPQSSPHINVAIGGDKSVPEYTEPFSPKDPFKIDVYCLGNLIREDLMAVSGVKSVRTDQETD